jgi:hypothetical protein
LELGLQLARIKEETFDRRTFFLLEHSDSTMKFTLAVTALTAATSAAFMPRSMSARGNSLHMSAVEQATYTFAKSEEIFAEAQEVGFVKGLSRERALRSPLCNLTR